MKDMASFSQRDPYDQEAFRYLLENESKRSERSGRFCQTLLVYWTDVEERIVQMDSDVTKTVMAALSRGLRETDYIGWYHDGCVVGAVLTGLLHGSMGQVASHLQKQLEGVLQSDLSLSTRRVRKNQVRRGNLFRQLGLITVRSFWCLVQ